MLKLLAAPDPLPAVRSDAGRRCARPVRCPKRRELSTSFDSSKSSDRLEEIDSIRRLAALIVDADYENTANAVGVT